MTDWNKWYDKEIRPTLDKKPVFQRVPPPEAKDKLVGEIHVPDGLFPGYGEYEIYQQGTRNDTLPYKPTKADRVRARRTLEELDIPWMFITLVVITVAQVILICVFIAKSFLP